MTNALDHPWVPVVHRDQGPMLLSLKDTLVSSGELTSLGKRLAPVELDAMMRFLSSVGALVLRNRGARLDDAQSVDAALEPHRSRFELLDADTPFLQEWHVSAEQRKQAAPGLGLAQLDIHTPGGSSSQWCLRTPREVAEPASLLPLMVTEWFHGKPSNAATPSFYREIGSRGRRIAGAPAGGPKDTSFFLLGPTLRDSILANIPKAWMRTADLPAWLDQDAIPSVSDLMGGAAPLWRYTWTPNRMLLLTDGGQVTGWVSGTTARTILPLSGTGDVKEDAKAVYPRLDRATTVVTAKGTALYVSQDLTRTQGIVDWYEKELDQTLSGWGRDRIFPRDECRIAFHTEDGDTYGNRSSSKWVELDLKLLTAPPSDERTVLLGMARSTVSLLRGRKGIKGQPGFPAVWRMAHADSSTPQSVFDAGALIYSALDGIVLPALSQVAAGGTPNMDDVTARIVGSANALFVGLTEPLLTPSTIAPVMQARSIYQRALRTRRKELLPQTVQEAAS